jgi:hypothetical protein
MGMFIAVFPKWNSWTGREREDLRSFKNFVSQAKDQAVILNIHHFFFLFTFHPFRDKFQYLSF